MKFTDNKVGRPYDNVVYQRMRHILMSYRNLWGGSAGKKYEWGELSSDIEYFCDIEFPKNSLENFIRGWYEKVEEKKCSTNEGIVNSVGWVHKFSIPQDDRIEAIIRFLTDKNSKGWFCDQDQLLAAPKFQAPFYLQEHLNHPEISDRYIIPEQLMGKYEGQYQGGELDVGRENHRNLGLHIMGAFGNGAVIVDLVKTNPYIHGNRTDTIKSINEEAELYSGWAVLSREENLFLFTKHFRTDCNEFYLSLGIDNKIYSNSPPDALILLAHDFPEDHVSIVSENDEQNLLDTVKENLLKKIILFRRVFS